MTEKANPLSREGAQGVQLPANAHSPSGCITLGNSTPAQPECLACETGQILPSFFHHCAIGAQNAVTLAEDYRTLVELVGEAFERPLRPHEIADFRLQNPEVDLTGAYVEIEPTDDLGMERTYYYTVDAGDPLFVTVGKLQGTSYVTGADARKWVSA